MVFRLFTWRTSYIRTPASNSRVIAKKSCFTSDVGGASGLGGCKLKSLGLSDLWFVGFGGCRARGRHRPSGLATKASPTRGVRGALRATPLGLQTVGVGMLLSALVGYGPWQPESCGSGFWRLGSGVYSLGFEIWEELRVKGVLGSGGKGIMI